MNILLIHQAFVSPNDAGGTRHYEFAQHACRNGHEFAIVASDLSYLTGQKASTKRGWITRETLNGIAVYRSYTYPSLHRSFRWRIVSFVSFMLTSIVAGLRAGPVDVVVGTSPPLFQALSAWIVAAFRRRPFILEIRDLWPEFAIDMGVLKSPVLIRAARILESFLYARADHLMVNSPAYRDYLLAKGVSGEKVTVVSNGVDPGMFQPENDGGKAREMFGLQGKFVVTYAGALGMANDLATVLRAAALLRDLPEICFLIVGDGKEGSGLKNLASDLGLKSVRFVGARPKSEIPEILAASDLCVATLMDIPMFRTTYPNKVFDYMAAGRPTILSIDGVIRKVIEDSQGGIFCKPGSDEAIAVAIRELYQNEERRRKMGRCAREFVERHFNRHAQARDFLRLIEQVGGVRPPAKAVVDQHAL